MLLFTRDNRQKWQKRIVVTKCEWTLNVKKSLFQLYVIKDLAYLALGYMKAVYIIFSLEANKIQGNAMLFVWSDWQTAQLSNLYSDIHHQYMLQKYIRSLCGYCV